MSSISDINKNSQPVFNFIHTAGTTEGVRNDDTMCKICLSSHEEDFNPLVNLCKCTGGIRFSHFECLKKWMETKLSIKENEKKNVSSYNIKAFNCEICKTPYPFCFKYNERNYDLIEIKRPGEKNYIILESLDQVKDNNNIKSIHVISLDNDKVTLGRGHESDVRINDISVSRTHASLFFDAGKIYIRDLRSKFGTLVLMKKEIQIKEKLLKVQIGRTCIDASLMPFKEYEIIRKNK